MMSLENTPPTKREARDPRALHALHCERLSPSNPRLRMARAVSLTYAFSCLLAVVAAKKKAEPAPTPEPLMSTEINFLVVAVACLVGAAAAKQMGIAPATVALGAAFAFAMLEAADLMLVKPYLGLSAFYPGHAPVTCILFAMPSKPATATAYGVLGGHVAATLSALAQVYFMPEALAFATKVITVGLAVGAMKVGDELIYYHTGKERATAKLGAWNSDEPSPDFNDIMDFICWFMNNAYVEWEEGQQAGGEAQQHAAVVESRNYHPDPPPPPRRSRHPRQDAASPSSCAVAVWPPSPPLGRQVLWLQKVQSALRTDMGTHCERGARAASQPAARASSGSWPNTTAVMRCDE